MKVHCNACGRDADEVTAACPHCGAVVSAPRRSRLMGAPLVFGLVVATVEMLVLLWYLYWRR